MIKPLNKIIKKKKNKFKNNNNKFNKDLENIKNLLEKHVKDDYSFH